MIDVADHRVTAAAAERRDARDARVGVERVRLKPAERVPLDQRVAVQVERIVAAAVEQVVADDEHGVRPRDALVMSMMSLCPLVVPNVLPSKTNCPPARMPLPKTCSDRLFSGVRSAPCP